MKSVKMNYSDKHEISPQEPFSCMKSWWKTKWYLFDLFSKCVSIPDSIVPLFQFFFPKHFLGRKQSFWFSLQHKKRAFYFIFTFTRIRSCIRNCDTHLKLSDAHQAVKISKAKHSGNVALSWISMKMMMIQFMYLMERLLCKIHQLCSTDLRKALTKIFTANE